MLWIVEQSTFSIEGLRLYRRIGAVNPSTKRDHFLSGGDEVAALPVTRTRAVSLSIASFGDCGKGGEGASRC
jgi:hypothetical protein